MPQTIPLLQTAPSWQSQLANLVTDTRDLLSRLDLTPEQAGVSEAAAADFPLRVPEPYLARMRRGDPRDPLLLQVLPGVAELLEPPGYCKDPLQETGGTTPTGLLHKYRDRVLLIATQSCAIHCRYCFRRHFPYSDSRPGNGHRSGRERWQDALDYIAADPGIGEVILSGGDPLATSNAYLGRLVRALAEIPQLKRLRLHTRLPIMLPERIDPELQDMLTAWNRRSESRAIVVLHANHAREFDTEVDSACARLLATGSQLLNQSVLLKGINDNADTLCDLSERLFAAGVLPYYLHMPDKVTGTAHFDVELEQALELQGQLQARLPGYLVPRLVREEPGKPAKTPLHG